MAKLPKFLKSDIAKTLGAITLSTGIGSTVGHQLAKSRFKEQRAADNARSRREVGKLVDAFGKFHNQQVQRAYNLGRKSGMNSRIKTAIANSQKTGIKDTTVSKDGTFERETNKHRSPIDPRGGLAEKDTEGFDAMIQRKKEASIMDNDMLSKLAKAMNDKSKETETIGGVKERELFGDDKPSVSKVDKATTGDLNDTGNNHPQQHMESKSSDSKGADPQYKNQDKAGALLKSASKAKAVAKYLGAAGLGAAGTGALMHSKHKKEKGQMVSDFKRINQLENKLIQKRMASKYRKLNRMENQALARHFYEAGRKSAGGK